ncbi:MAG: hypothetical protein ABII80_02750 [bacterium]
MAPCIEFISADYPVTPSECVYVKGDVGVGSLNELPVLSIVLPSIAASCEVDRALDELRPDRINIKVSPDKNGNVIDIRTKEILPNGYETQDPLNSQIQIKIRTAILES